MLRDDLGLTPLKCSYCKTPMRLTCGNSGFSYWFCGICNKEFEFHICTEKFTDEINIVKEKKLVAALFGRRNKYEC